MTNSLTRFRSADGRRRELRVETFGGGTWISNFSLMTGLSSLDFGWRAPYLTTAMEGKIHESLATELSPLRLPHCSADAHGSWICKRGTVSRIDRLR
jgi:hypothetical protein